MKLKYIVAGIIAFLALSSSMGYAETNGCTINTYALTHRGNIWSEIRFKHHNARTPGRNKIEKILEEDGYSVVTDRDEESDFNISSSWSGGPHSKGGLQETILHLTICNKKGKCSDYSELQAEPSILNYFRKTYIGIIAPRPTLISIAEKIPSCEEMNALLP